MKKLLGAVALAGIIIATGCSHGPGTDDNGTPAGLPQQPLEHIGAKRYRRGARIRQLNHLYGALNLTYRPKRLDDKPQRGGGLGRRLYAKF